MGKRWLRAMVAVALAAGLALSLGTAHADTAVTIDDPDGATLYSLPTTGGLVEDPADTTLSGTAAFSTGGGGVQVVFADPASGDPPQNVVTYQAGLACNEAGTTCTWSFRVPFIFKPGEWDVTATAADDVGSASATISITVI